MVDIPMATFTYDELREILEEQGFIPGTDEFKTEFHRRYRTVDHNPSRYMERYRWLNETAA